MKGKGRPFGRNKKSGPHKSKPQPPSYDVFDPNKKGGNKRLKSKRQPKSEDIRLNKFIANAGVCSRREADSLIESGKIKVNGKVVIELGTKVMRSDKVTYQGKILNPEKLVYVLLNKPKDFITTTNDPRDRKTVMQLVKNACDERIVPVGRLDRNTTGLLLLTNDGELADKLTHPKNQIVKVYQVDLDKPINENDLARLDEGIELEDGLASADNVAILSADKTILGLEIHMGKNRIVRRMFEAMGYDVVRLDRVMFAGLTKKDLNRGRWRYLSEKEVIRLKYLNKKY